MMTLIGRLFSFAEVVDSVVLRSISLVTALDSVVSGSHIHLVDNGSDRYTFPGHSQL